MEKEFAPAKVNLFLDVLNKRADGYHDLGTVFQTLDMGDFLSAEKNSSGEITLSYNVSQDYPVEKDLVFRAAKLLQETTNTSCGAKLYLEKLMPLGAGLGGGSADAAAALRLLNRIWETNLSCEELEKLGAKLGADVPFLVQGGTAFAEGIGEKLRPTSVEFPKAVLVATPHCAVPTKDAYAGVVPSGENRWNAFKSNWNGTLSFEFYNKFEESVFPKYPIIQDLKNKLENSGAFKTLMSGSGASVFALFDSKTLAETALEKLGTTVRFKTITAFKECFF
jgi:4-diphosphocytidyl-2-C-methyl-D-erythritol kinase